MPKKLCNACGDGASLDGETFCAPCADSCFLPYFARTGQKGRWIEVALKTAGKVARRHRSFEEDAMKPSILSVRRSTL